MMRTASTAMYHLFQYDLSLFIFFYSTKVHKGSTEINKEDLSVLCVSLRNFVTRFTLYTYSCC